MGTESLETDGKSMDDAKKTKEELIEQVRALRFCLITADILIDRMLDFHFGFKYPL